jgi:DNA polymerase III epsilon subunit-like protein|tara:strand:+ start:609 stop:1247 length:639 start_codon:yes stop_codon:yes gene_type:complete
MDGHLIRFDEDKTFVFIDCETENLCLNSFNNLPWQIAMIKAKGGQILDSKDYYVGWDRDVNVSVEAARITRFNPVDYDKRKIKFEEIFPTIEDWLDNADYIVGHNILGFDIYLIKDFYNYVGKDYRHLMSKIIDTNCIARGIKFELPYRTSENFLEYQYKLVHERRKGIKTNLTALGREFQIEHDYDRLHDALVDLELNLKVWNQLKYQLEM